MDVTLTAGLAFASPRRHCPPMTRTLLLAAALLPVALPARADSVGTASFYGAELHGRRTASGERFDRHAMTAAHRRYPFGTRLLVTNLANGRSVAVRVNDRGPFTGGRIIDLSQAAAGRIGMVGRGTAKVRVAVVAR
jgi:rare lipoprotein A